MKGVVAIPKFKIILREMLVNVLKTHNNLNTDDINYMISFIFHLDLTDNDLAKFITQTYKMLNTGRYSLFYNYKLDQYIKDRTPELLYNQIKLTGSVKAWPELYCNDLLNENEIDVIDEISKREFNVILYTIEESHEPSCKTDQIVLPTFNSSQISQDSDGIYYNSLYSKCYDKVCIVESKQKGKIVNLDSKIPEVAYVIDTDNTTKEIKFCFNLMNIIERLSKENYTNPKSNKPFSDRTKLQLLDKYQTEIKLYKKYLNKIRNK